MKMSIDNGIVVLPDNIPVNLRFSSIKVTPSERKDRATGHIATVNRYSAQVIELNGQKVLTVYDTLSEKLGNKLLPYANDPALSRRVFTITKSGSGYLTEYSLEVSPPQ